MNYSTLVAAKTVDGAIRQWVNWGPVPATNVLQLAEDTIYADLRAQEMRLLTTGTIASAATSIALPTGFREIVTLRRTGDYAGPIRILDAEHFESRLAIDETTGNPFEGTPTEGALDGLTALRLNATADQDFPYRLWYYGAPSRLSTSNETNFLTDRYSHMLLAACLYWAYSFAKDNGQRDHWFAVMKRAIAEANAESDLGRQVETAAIHWGVD